MRGGVAHEEGALGIADTVQFSRIRRADAGMWHACAAQRASKTRRRL